MDLTRPMVGVMWQVAEWGGALCVLVILGLELLLAWNAARAHLNVVTRISRQHSVLPKNDSKCRMNDPGT